MTARYGGKRMNVLMLTPEFLPVWGGAGTYVVEIAKNMPQRDIQVHIITPKRIRFGSQLLATYDKLQKIPAENIHVHYIGQAKDTFIYNFTFQLNCWRNIYSLIKEHKIDIIQSQSAMPDLFISSKKVKVPIVTTIHTTIEGQINVIKSSGSRFRQLEFSEKMTLFLSPFLKFLEDKYYDGDRYYITVSEWAKNQIIREKEIDAERIRVIHNGVDSDEFNPLKRKEAEKYFLQLADVNVPKVLCLSRLIESKGLSFLIEAIPEILEKVDVHFIFAGPGKKPILNMPNGKYTFLGYVSHEQTPYLYALSDIFILPSLCENFPMSILEAMASECAVIATDVGGVPEMIDHNVNGVLIPPKDSESIAKATVNLIQDNNLRRNLGKKARKTVEDRFDWKNAAERTKQYYEEVLSNESLAR